VQPHSALSDRSPEEIGREWRALSATSLRTAGPLKEASAGAVHCIAGANPKLIQLSGPPQVELRGEAEKLPSARAEQAVEPGDLLESFN